MVILNLVLRCVTEFYLIMNVAVGGTNGFFPDGQGNKPWFNGDKSESSLHHASFHLGTYFLILSLDAMRSFAEAQSQWYPTWPQNLDDRAMVVDYVKMWRHCDGD